MSQAFEQIKLALSAFNQNAVNSLLYIMQQNIWFVVIALSAIAAMLMMLKEEIDYSVNEEQEVL